ncbi:hypothetical protein NPIL_202541 [Nephila pilipes]|uniref:Uncharacterized protein n=1 Tax=Nephila pilipes TaxID=299642 RepID=A0A8X6N1H9_NEPPI|nr:hypothetical protein NPIL_202541 [Nephila pilipes]
MQTPSPLIQQMAPRVDETTTQETSKFKQPRNQRCWIQSIRHRFDRLLHQLRVGSIVLGLLRLGYNDGDVMISGFSRFDSMWVLPPSVSYSMGSGSVNPLG